MSKLGVLSYLFLCLLLGPILCVSASDADLPQSNARRLLDCTRPGCNFNVAGTDMPLAHMPPPYRNPHTGKVSPKIYIYDLPDKYTNEHFWTLGTVSLINRLRESGYVTSNGDEADYYWLPHSMPMPRPLILEMFDLIKREHPWWNRTVAAHTARHIMVLPCEKGPGDCSFTMLYDRELWPVHTPISPNEPGIPPELNPANPERRVMFMTLNGLMDGYPIRPCLNCFQRGKDIQLVTGHAHQCGPLCGYSLEELRQRSPFSKLSTHPGSAANNGKPSSRGGHKGGDSSGGLFSRLLGRESKQHTRNIAALHDHALGMAQRLCKMRLGDDGTPEEVEECVQKLYENGWSKQIVSTAHPAPHRSTTLFWAGNVRNAPVIGVDNSGRYHAMLYHHNRPGFLLVNTHEVTLRDIDLVLPPHPPVNYVEEMLRSKFCLVPLGTRGGDPDRYIPAVLFQCIPVWVGSSRATPMARPLEEHPDVKWDECSLAVDLEDMAQLHEILATYSESALAAMRRCLAGMWQRMLYSTIFGSYLGEDGKNDAFDAIMTILRRRLEHAP